jgi:rsbT co-antagonist protein RsbR
VLLPVMVVGMSMIPLLVLALLLPYLSSRGVLVTGAACVLMILIIFLLGELAPMPLAAPSPTVALLLSCLGAGIIGGLTALLLWQYNTRMTATLTHAEAANGALEEARATLEQQVTARTTDLRRALVDMEARAEAQAQLLAENAEQRDQIREMSVPVLPVSRDTIAIPLIGALDTQRLQVVQEQALAAIESSRARYIILDVTGVPVVDTQVAQGIIGVVSAARLLGAEAVLVGVRPDVAQTVVALGIDLHAITTRQSLHEGIAYSSAKSEERGAKRRGA